MFDREDCQALKTLINNSIITPKDHKTPIKVLDTIQTKMKEHLWH